MPYLLVISGLVLIVASVPVWRRRRWNGPRMRRLQGAGAVFCLLFGLASASAGGYWFWYFHRPLPKPENRLLFEGVRYIREVRRLPRPMVIHVVQIDLSAPGIGFLVTPPNWTEDGHQLRARTTGGFLEGHKLQLAINANYFAPFHSKGLTDYYPREGDGVSAMGTAISRGKTYADRGMDGAVLFLSKENEATIGFTRSALYNAVSGHYVLVRDGKVVPPPAEPKVDPRTAVGIDKDEKTLILVLIDGRQPSYSEGATFEELGAILQQYGAHTAIDLDGGGSTTLAIDSGDGSARILNWPIHTRVPGRQRPVANHLGVFARPLAR